MATKTIPLSLGTRARQNRSRLLALLGLMVVLGVVAAIVNLRFISRSPVRVHIQKGIDAYQSGQTDVAITEWRQAMRLDPTHPDPYRLLAEALLVEGQAKEALPLLRQLEKVAPKTPHLYCRLAEATALASSDSRALDAAKEAVGNEPECGKAHALYGIAMSEQSNHVIGISELSRAMVLSPGDTAISLSLAQAQLNGGDFDGVEKTTQTVIAREPNNAKAHYFRGWAYSRKTMTPENVRNALHELETAYKQDAHLTDVPVQLGRLSVQVGDYRAALPYLENAWKDAPTAETAFLLAKACRGVGNTARAAEMTAQFKTLSDIDTHIDALQKRLVVNPKDISAGIELVGWQIKAKNWEDASSLVQSLLKIRQNDPTILRLALTVSEATGDRAAIPVLRQRLARLGKGSEVAR